MARVVVDTDGRLLDDSDHDHSFDHFDGRLAVFATPGIENWFHWLIQALPRMISLTDEDFDAIHVPPNLTKPQELSLQRALEASGLSRRAIFRTVGKVRARGVIAPEIAWHPSRGDPLPLPVLHFVRSLARIHPSPRRRIYVSRRGYSRFSPSLEALMGIVIDVIDPSIMTFDEQASAFASAGLIVAPHGSGLANLVFCSPGTRVVELYDPRRIGKTFCGVYSKLASAAGCFHRHVSINEAGSDVHRNSDR
jgi:capsular polysaccharide biosynthesis protein